MTAFSTRLASASPWQRLRALLAAGLGVLALTLPACGGGGVGEGGTGFGSAYSSGAITGFGSVIVNDIVFDDTVASVVDGDGVSRSRSDLHLGMTVEVDSGPIASSGGSSTASATQVRYDSALVGPVASINLSGNSFVVLGQSVVVDEFTAFDASLTTRLGALSNGQLVEVYGVFDAALARFRATRVEPRSSASGYKLRGFVAQVDASAKTLRIGSAQFSWASAAGLGGAPAVGQAVRLSLATTPLNGGVWQITSFGTAVRSLGDLAGFSVKGLVTAFTSSASFQVDGRAVNASGAQFPDGTSGLAVGARVEVDGAVRAGVFVATQVRLRSDDFERARGFELKGLLESVNAVARTFVLRGQVVSYARSDLVFEGGSAAGLLTNVRVEVKGLQSPTGAVLEATRIKFDN